MRIFLAHASEDKVLVRGLYSKLKLTGFDPWLDEIDLLPGQDWKSEIRNAIRKSDIFIACLSRNSIQKQGYVQREFRMALDTCAEKPPGSVYLIPLRFDQCEIPDLQIPSLGLSLRDYQWLDLWKSDGFERLVKSLSAKKEALGDKSLTSRSLKKLTSGTTFKNIEGINLPDMDDDLEKLVEFIVSGFSYGAPTELQRNLSFLKQIASQTQLIDVKEIIFSRLKQFFCDGTLYERPLSNKTRGIRAEIFTGLAEILSRDLSAYFQDGTLETLDLYGMNFSGLRLENVSFSSTFLVAANFKGAALQGCDFSYSSLRNVDFTGATLTDVDFANADWFNASGLTAQQLSNAKKETLLPCPRDRDSLHSYLDEVYSFPFRAWAGNIQRQLTRTWDEYLQAGGLFETVSSWQRNG